MSFHNAFCRQREDDGHLQSRFRWTIIGRKNKISSDDLVVIDSFLIANLTLVFGM
jgi:hypothetical protein